MFPRILFFIAIVAWPSFAYFASFHRASPRSGESARLLLKKSSNGAVTKLMSTVLDAPTQRTKTLSAPKIKPAKAIEAAAKRRGRASAIVPLKAVDAKSSNKRVQRNMKAPSMCKSINQSGRRPKAPRHDASFQRPEVRSMRLRVPRREKSPLLIRSELLLKSAALVKTPPRGSSRRRRSGG